MRARLHHRGAPVHSTLLRIEATGWIANLNYPEAIEKSRIAVGLTGDSRRLDPAATNVVNRLAARERQKLGVGHALLRIE